MRRLILFALLSGFFCGCATTGSTILRTDPELITASQALSLDYLNGQKRGQSYSDASELYGRGVSEFYNLQEIQGCDRRGMLYWEPSVECRVKSGNKMGGITWSNYCISFSYSQELRAHGDKYSGLRIKNVIESSLAYTD